MRKPLQHLLSILALFGALFFSANKGSAQTNSGRITLNTSTDPTEVNPGTTITVNLFLNKGYMGGLARFDAFVPRALKASEAEDDGSKFYMVDTIVHFQWQHMPENPDFKVSFRLKIPANALGNYTINSQFIYLGTDGAQTVYFAPFTFNVQKPVITQNVPLAPKPIVVNATWKDTANIMPPVNTPTVVAARPNDNTAPDVASKPATAPVVANKTTVAAKTKTEPPVKAVYDSKRPVCYRVQIMATSAHLDADSVIINGFRDRLYITNVNGIYKYSVGSFNDLQSAVDYRKRIITNGLLGPFVVAYKDGTKITIKESLEIIKTN